MPPVTVVRLGFPETETTDILMVVEGPARKVYEHFGRGAKLFGPGEIDVLPIGDDGPADADFNARMDVIARDDSYDVSFALTNGNGWTVWTGRENIPTSK